MKLPYSMLLSMVQTDLRPHECGDLLTMAGFELEGLEAVEGSPVLDIKVVANRGDGLSALGLAREILAKDPTSIPTPLYLSAMERFPSADEREEGASNLVNVEIETEDCSRYAARIIGEVQNGDSPPWLKSRIIQAGMRPISLLVDLTNYVLLERGQPLHAFDLDKLRGSSIVVRKAKPGEEIMTLNGEAHELQPGQMMICDAERPVAVAGVMGGLETEVTASTKRVLLESAHFMPASVRRTRKQLGLNTEASYRFERWVDPDGVVSALNRFVFLYQAILEGRTEGECLASTTLDAGSNGLVPGVVQKGQGLPPRSPITMRPARCHALLGMPVSPEECRSYLQRLGFAVEAELDVLTVFPPSWRPDVVREIDLIEEVGRVHGFDKIPELLPVGQIRQGGVFGLERKIDSVREQALRCGLTQIMSNSLRDRHLLDFTEDWRVTIRNPHAPEMAFLRDSLLPGLSEAAQRNGSKNLHLFEIGKVFVKGAIQFDESPELAILSTGALDSIHWESDELVQASFFSLKGQVEAISEAIGVHPTFDYPKDPDRRLHPTRQSGVLVDEGKLWAGTIGQIHPELAERLDLPELTFLGELDLFVLCSEIPCPLELKQLSRNPAVRRDIAVVLPLAVTYSVLEVTIARVCGSLLEKQWLFDVYTGTGIEKGHHSLAIALQLRKYGENLTDEEANQVRDSAVAALAELGGKLR